MNNPPAFPHTVHYATETSAGIVPHGGMTLRDYFAAKAMGGVVAATPAQIPIDEPHLAKWSYKMADAMLKAREA